MFIKVDSVAPESVFRLDLSNIKFCLYLKKYLWFEASPAGKRYFESLNYLRYTVSFGKIILLRVLKMFFEIA